MTTSDSRQTPPIRDIAIVLAAMFAFSMMALFTRAAGASVLGMAAWRAIMVTAVFAGMTIWRDGHRTLLAPDRTTLRLGGLLGAALAVASSTFVGGYAFTTIANTIFLHNLAPVVVFPLAWWLFRERPLPAALTGAGIALVGVAMLTGVSLFQVAHFANPRFLLGDGLALASAGGYGAVIVLTRATRQAGTPILATLTLSWGIAAVLLSVVALFAGDFWLSPSALAWTFGLAVLCTNLPFYLLNVGMQRVSAGLASVLSLSEVVFATILGVVVYSEHLAPVGWLGGLLATAGVAYAIATDDGPRTENAHSSLAPETLTNRGARAGVALLALNAGAIATLVGHPGASVVLAWAGLTSLARLGPALAAPGMPARIAPTMSWAGGLAAAAVVATGLTRGLPETGDGSIWIGAAALAYGACDRWLARRETEGDRDPNHLLHLGLVLLVLAQAAALQGHRAADLLATAALLSVAVAAAATAAAGLRGFLLDRRAPEAFARIEGPVAQRLTAPRAAIALVLVWLSGTLHAVPAGHVAIVERLGTPSAPHPAGLLVTLPAPIDRVLWVDVATLRRSPLSTNDTPVLCGDQSLVTIDATLHYRVSDPTTFAYATRDPDAAIRALASNALLEAVATRSHDVVLTGGREDLEATVLKSTQTAADAARLGIEVVATPIITTAVPPSVTAAFLDVISADEERETAINRAEAYAANLLPRTGGAAVERLAKAHGTAAQTLAEAEATLARTHALVSGGGAQPRLTLARLRWEAIERALGPRPLVLAPSTIPVWLGSMRAPPTPLPRAP